MFASWQVEKELDFGLTAVHEKPKQFIDLLDNGRSLLRMTFDRFVKVVPKSNIFVMTNKDYQSLVLEDLPELTSSQVFLESFMRNTAPAIAFAAYKIGCQNPKANLVFSPADHLIQNEAPFLDALKRGLAYSAAQQTVGILGIKPTFPHTGYGYIQFDSKTNPDEFSCVKSFTEKPNVSIARRLSKVVIFCGMPVSSFGM